jgi:hypothetical protein
MEGKWFTDEQITHVLRQAEDGTTCSGRMSATGRGRG